MKVLFISDIHGKIDNLNIINYYDFDKLVVLGDLFSYSGDNQQVINTLLKYKDKLVVLKGNCDYSYDFSDIDKYTFDDIYPLNLNGKVTFCTHGNIYNKSNIPEGINILIFGHKHIPYIEIVDNVKCICVGSISIPRGGCSASFGYYDGEYLHLYTTDNILLDKIRL